MAAPRYSANAKRQAAAVACIRGAMRDGRSLLDAEFMCLSPAERAAISAARNVPMPANNDEESTLTMIKRRGWDGPNMAELGFGFRSIGRGLKKVGKGVAKAHVVAGKTFVKANVAVAKMSAKLALLPLKYLVQAAIKIGRTLCKAPPQLLEMAAKQANVDPKFIPLFCTAVRENKLSLGSIKRMLPPALKIASKMAASGAFPPIVPVLSVVKNIPYVNRFAGADDLGSYASNLRNPAIRPAVDTMEMLALSDHLGLLGDSDVAALGLSDEDRIAMQGYLAASANESSGSLMPLVVIAAILGVGFFVVRRK